MNVSTAAPADAESPAWWQGLWFEGVFDPRGTAFAASLAVGATLAMVVVATALVRIVAGV